MPEHLRSDERDGGRSVPERERQREIEEGKNISLSSNLNVGWDLGLTKVEL